MKDFVLHALLSKSVIQLEFAVKQNQIEDLREFYITPQYLKIMGLRVKKWSDQLIKDQLHLFSKTIPDYPEVLELLEGELYRRELEVLRKKIKLMSTEQIIQLSGRYEKDSDFRELIQVELDLRKRLKLI